MKIKNIIVDSNFLIKDYNLNSRGTILLIKLKDYHKINLLIPHVVYDECIGNYKKEASKAHADISSSLDKYRKILIEIEKTKIDQDKLMEGLSHLSNFYKPHLDRFIENNKIEKIPYPSISHEHVVKKMYQGELPFKQDKTEVGYKDYLIITSIKEHIDQNDVTVILSKNLKDFCNADEKNKSNQLIPLSKNLDAANIYLMEDITQLSDILSTQLSLEHTESPWERQEIEEFLKSTIDDSMYSSEIYGDFLLLDVNTQKIIVSISSLQAQQSDIQDGYVEITGKVKIQMDCSFEVNQFSYSLIDKNFVFYDVIVEGMRKFKYEENDENFWEIKFNNHNYCREFDFNITDFDYKKGKTIKDAFLTLSSVAE